ncbi:BMP family ABC transporter substrate-binding protein [Pelagibacterium luteolum]|uniref:Simple sugar transport system substrate-binding protein n=1 Tax=Pelagibacterium luteolum TaxID=440168 RepID=A0A1G7UW45_9HYPH|nr:BMP family ABC transporter substrate-binding protein [Pelagibacterium luteolum]SDG50950.1 simple sugar transport system substrate-binding protein [Pelagibacterium luteolum]
MKTLLTTLATATALSLTLVPAAQAQQDTAEACFVYVGSHTDGGWSQAHDIARLEMEEHFGGAVTSRFIENVAEASSEGAIERMARSGCDIIFTTSFGFMDPTVAVAERFPDVKFEHATGYKTAPNLSVYNSRFYEGRYIQGVIAASISETGTAGYIGSFPIPEVVQGINAFMLGAQSINPDFAVRVVWANSWYDPGAEADAARVLMDQGVDIITQHTDSTAPMQEAAARGIKAFGQASDMIEAGPETQLTAIVDTWAPYYIERVQAVLDGTWETSDTWDGLVDGILTMAPYTNMPEDVAALATETEEAIKAGELIIFEGPINRQDGTVWLAEGEQADDGTLLGLNFYVEGVDDQLPQ